MKFKFIKKLKLQYILILILTIVLLYFSLNTIYLLFLKFNKKTNFPTKFIEKNETNTVTEHFSENIWGRFIFYSNHHCGKCAQLKDNWNELFEKKDDKECSQEINGCRFNNKLIKFIIVNCNEEENSCYNIKSYPTFILEIIKQNKIIEYTGVYNIQNIKQWLQDQTK